MKEPNLRKEINNRLLREKEIAVNEYLPILESSAEINWKSKDEIVNRFLACFFASQLACDLANGEKKESKEFFRDKIEAYHVSEYLTPKEKKMFYENVTQKEACNLSWTTECADVLFWALSLKEELPFPREMCPVRDMVTFIQECKDDVERLKKVKMRDTEEILDEADLEYRYHWACVEKRINPETKIGDLYPDVVWERRRALEWLISGEDEWDNISLDT